MSAPFRRLRDGWQLAVHLQPGARSAGIGPCRDGRLVVRVREPAREGRANAALIEVLAAALHLAPSRLRVARGAAGRHKQVVLTAGAEIEPALGALGRGES